MQNFLNGIVPVVDNKASSLYALAKNELKDIYAPDELGNIANWLVEHYTGFTPSQLIQQPDLLVNQSTIIHYCNAVEELKKGTPVQYVIGVVNFYGLQLHVNPSVLIPRPETEELVDMIVQEHKIHQPLTLLDIGTGSGCIALSLATRFLQTKVTAIDISADALETAKINAVNNRIKDIEWIEMDILQENDFAEKEFDIIVSNPPYISASERLEMAKNVVEFEPHQALFVPDTNPLIFYQAIAKTAFAHLRKGGSVYLEINEKLGPETLDLFTPNTYAKADLLKDMFGKNRFIKAVKL